MSSWAIKLRDGTTNGPYTAAGEVSEALEAYRAENPDDPGFTRITVWEMSEGGTAGREVSVYEFVPE